jgi:hypothetical protein
VEESRPGERLAVGWKKEERRKKASLSVVFVSGELLVRCRRSGFDEWYTGSWSEFLRTSFREFGGSHEFEYGRTGLILAQVASVAVCVAAPENALGAKNSQNSKKKNLKNIRWKEG